MTDTTIDIDAAANEAATSALNDTPEPSTAQIAAGNYRKGHIAVHGLAIAIENPKDSERSGYDARGKPWFNTMAAHYGYLKRTEGADGDQVDVFVGEDPESDKVYVIDQLDRNGQFDEHKVLLAFPNRIKAVAAYKGSYSKDWIVGPIAEMNIEQFKEWLTGDTTIALEPGSETTSVIRKQQVQLLRDRSMSDEARKLHMTKLDACLADISRKAANKLNRDY